jgi:23S rRNA pseudouridine1911/1915/1917 synthase
MVDGVEHYQFEVQQEHASRRLDKFLRDIPDEPDISRSQIKKRLERGEITVNGDCVKAGYSLNPGDVIEWTFEEAREIDLEPQALPIELLYEDHHLAVVDKPAGMVVHPAPGHPDGTLVNALLHHLTELSGIGGDKRPGIVHRIDKDTSGCLVVAKTDDAHHHLAEQFKEHTIERRYHAIVFAAGLTDEGTFETGHGRDPSNRIRYTGDRYKGREAITHYRVLERFETDAALVECQLETGRTHQIRMHFYEANNSLLGDDLYGGTSTSQASIVERQALHARSLQFEHPETGELKYFESPYPEDFTEALQHLRDGEDWR